MNEEENQAIEFLKHSIFEYDEIDTSVMEYIDKNHKIIYKLILKQQKEIEEFKRDYNKQIKETNAENKRCMFLAVENQDLKDKIKEKIEAITSYAYTSAEERDCQDYAIQVLKELLGETNVNK